MTPARFRWGMLLILFGVLILLKNIDVINYNFFIDLLAFFPFFLIAVGIEKIFTRSRAEFIAYLSSVFLLVGGIYIAYTGSYGGSDSSFFEASTYRLDMYPTLKAVHATVDLDENDLTIRDASSSDLLYSRFRKFTRKPKIDFNWENDEAYIDVKGRSRNLIGGLVKIETDERSDWYLSFSKVLPLFLKCFGKNADIHLNLSTTPLRELELNAKESDIYLKLGDMEPRVVINLGGDESSLRLRVPTSSGLKIKGGEYRELFDEIGLVEQQGYFLNDSYDSLRSKIDVNLEDNLSSVSIDFY
ncbi:MAG: hypothetical protein JXA92_12780 [candidate division Zixibacteria bacterium]|nr:hypothetical protein [candidate division Zixibacteria bacterium]